MLLIEPTAGRLAATIRLTGVKAGRVPMGGADLYDVQDMWPGLAWDHPRQRLYIAHADEDRLTVVDLQQGRLLAQAVIRPRASLLGYLADWLIPTTVAKGNNAISRAALLSPDGRRLYVSVLMGMVGAPPRPAWVARVFDLTTRQFVAERALENWFEGALIAARARQ